MNVNPVLFKNKKSVLNKENICKEGKIAPKKSDIAGKIVLSEMGQNKIQENKYSLLRAKPKILEKTAENKKIVESLIEESKENSDKLINLAEIKNTQINEPSIKSKKEIRMTIREANDYLNITENTKIILEGKLQTRFSSYIRK